MSNRQQISVQEAELINAGFRPARHSGVVRLVRRLLWPFVRPFHFYTLGRIQALTAGMHGEIEALTIEVAALRETLDILSRATPRTADIQGLVLRQSAQWAELTVLANRHAWIEDAFDAVLAQTKAGLNEASRAQATLETDLETKFIQTRGRLDDLSRTQATIEDRLHQYAHRSRLFLSATQEGMFLLKEGELISDTAAREGHWDAHILRVATRAAEVALERNDGRSVGRAVDAGAHFGLISVALARRFDRVTSFEPNEFNAALLRANVALNGVSDRVDVHQAALFSHKTMLSLAPSELQEIPLPLDQHGKMDPLAATNLGAYSFTEHGSGLSEAAGFTLDSLRLDDVAFIKVDVQGADGEVLMGALDTIRTCNPWIVFEWEDALSEAFGVALSELVGRMEEMGYVLRVLKRHNAKQVDYLAVPAADTARLDDLLEAEVELEVEQAVVVA